jgi:hypothetical protein
MPKSFLDFIKGGRALSSPARNHHIFRIFLIVLCGELEGHKLYKGSTVAPGAGAALPTSTAGAAPLGASTAPAIAVTTAPGAALPMSTAGVAPNVVSTAPGILVRRAAGAALPTLEHLLRANLVPQLRKQIADTIEAAAGPQSKFDVFFRLFSFFDATFFWSMLIKNYLKMDSERKMFVNVFRTFEDIMMVQMIEAFVDYRQRQMG